jgi:hypothetical protein
MASSEALLRSLQKYAHVPSSEVALIARELDEQPLAGYLTTGEALTIPVDYVAGTSVDPPAGTVLATQLDVTRALAGAPAFKHLQLVYNALPRDVNHPVTFNLAAGIHRPHPTLPAGIACWLLNTKFVFPNGSINFNGAPPSLYTPRPTVPTAQAVTAIQAASGDPYIDVAGTPWATFNLKGSYAVLNTGQAALIHDHTDSRLFVLGAISPVPSSILFIGRPSTVLRNSVNDTTAFKIFTLQISSLGSANAAALLLGSMNFQDVMVDPFGAASNVWSMILGAQQLTRVVMDQDSVIDNVPAGTPNGNGWVLIPDFLSSTLGAAFNDCSFINRQTSGGADLLISITGAMAVQRCYFENSEDAVVCRAPGALVSFRNTVFNSVGQAVGANAGSLTMEGAMRVDFNDAASSGKQNEFRNGKASVPCVVLRNGAHTRTDVQYAQFKDNAAQCVLVKSGSVADVSGCTAGQGFKNVSGNADVGIEVAGPGAVVNLNTGTDVTGTAGDVRLAGLAVAYAAIPATGVGDSALANAARRA